MLYRLHFLRFIAAFAVLLHHCQSQLNQSLLTTFHAFQGQWGVDLFFIISGFVIHTSTANLWQRPGSSVEFSLRRIIRIYPLYTSLTLLMATMLVIAPSAFSTYHFSIQQLLLSLSLWPSQTPPYLGVAWTLSYEMVFYLCYALLLALSQNRTYALALIPLFGLGSILWLFNPSDVGIRAFAMDGLLMEFCLGVISAELCLRKIKLHTPTLLALALLLLITLFPIAHMDQSYRLIGFALPLWPIFHILVQGEWLSLNHHSQTSWLSKPWIVALGESSYALYLSHPISLKFSALLLHKFPSIQLHKSIGTQLLAFTIALSLSLFFALGLWKFFDQPVQTFLRSKLPRSTPIYKS